MLCILAAFVEPNQLEPASPYVDDVSRIRRDHFGSVHLSYNGIDKIAETVHLLRTAARFCDCLDARYIKMFDQLARYGFNVSVMFFRLMPHDVSVIVDQDRVDEHRPDVHAQIVLHILSPTIVPKRAD